ncbi:MAG: ribonuclease H-like domain-containing protein [Patescibacteria group bacterium]
MNTLCIDIETIPVEEAKRKEIEADKEARTSLRRLKPGSNEELFRQTALDGNYGRIVCIGYLRRPSNSEKAMVLTGEEADILAKFWEMARDIDLFIGHNIYDFDLKFIYKRSIIHGIKPSQWLPFARYRSNPIYDTMSEWEKWTFGARIKLDELAKILGLKSSKQGIDGSKVYDYFLKGKAEAIYKYCQADVELTQAIYDKMTFQAG